MRKLAISMTLAFILLAASVVPFIPIEKAYSLLPGTETFTIPVQKDSFLKQGSQAHNEGANIILDIISSDKHRPVIAFDANAINSAVNGRQLQSATLQVFITENGNNWGADGNTIGAHKILSDWNEGNGWNLGGNAAGTGTGVTWGCAIDEDISNNQNDCATQWNGGSFQSPATGNTLITNNLVYQWIELDVTLDVQAFLDGTATNYGWLIKKTSESQNGAIEFASKESGANSPVLQITVIKPEAVLANEYLTLIDELDYVGRNLNQTVISQQLVDDINADLTRLKEIVIELQNLGFDGEASATRVDQQMVGTVKFYSSDTSELLFETQIPDGALGIFAVMGLKNEFSEEEVEIPFDLLATSLSSSYNLVQAATNFEDDDIATDFVLASVAAFHPSTGNTFTLVWTAAGKAARAIASAIMRCFANDNCKLALDEFLTQPGDDKFLEWAFPSFRVSGTKFNDLNDNGVRDSEEPGISGWLFVVSTFNAPRIFEDFSSELGEFIIEGQYPRTSHTLVVTEILQNGWIATTLGGEIQEIFFNVTAIPFNPIPGTPVGIFQPDPLLFGNFQLGEISGFKYNDVNGNAIRDTGEEGLPGWTILLKNATTGATINSTTTNSDGLYLFTGLEFGSYRVEEMQQEGYTQTEPASGFYVIDIQSGTFSLGNDFGNRADAPDPDIIWYGGSDQTAGQPDAAVRLQNYGYDVEKRTRPISDLGAARVVVIARTGITNYFSTSEVNALKDYVNNGGKLVLGVDTDYFHCARLGITCSMDVSTNWGIKFGGNIGGTLRPGASIWTTPNQLSSFSNWCCDGYVTGIFDPNIRVLAQESGRPGIVINENPAFNGGRVMGTGYNMFVGLNGDFRLFDNIMTFLLGETLGSSSLLATTSGGTSGGPYHYVELNQTSANVTRPDSVTVEVEVEWHDPAWPAQPVEITLGNVTGTNITYAIESTYNTTEYQIFEITFNITEDVQPGDYQIPIMARDIEDGYLEQATFVLSVE